MLRAEQRPPRVEAGMMVCSAVAPWQPNGKMMLGPHMGGRRGMERVKETGMMRPVDA